MFGAPSGGRSGSIGGNAVSGSFASYVRDSDVLMVRNRQNAALNRAVLRHLSPSLELDNTTVSADRPAAHPAETDEPRP